MCSNGGRGGLGACRVQKRIPPPPASVVEIGLFRTLFRLALGNLAGRRLPPGLHDMARTGHSREVEAARIFQKTYFSETNRCLPSVRCAFTVTVMHFL